MPILNPEKTTVADVKAFLRAAYIGDLLTVQSMILNGTVHVNDCLDDESFQNVPAGTTALMIAALRAHKAIVNFLLCTDYEFSHRYIAKDAAGNVADADIDFDENFARRRVALSGIALTHVNSEGENAFSLALKSNGDRRDRDEIAGLLIDAVGKREFSNLSQHERTQEEIQAFFQLPPQPVDVLSNASDAGLSDSEDSSNEAEVCNEEDSSNEDDTESSLSAVDVTFTQEDMFAALVQAAQKRFVSIVSIPDPVAFATEQRLFATVKRLLKLGLPFDAAEEIANRDNLNHLNKVFDDLLLVEQEPMDHATREQRSVIESIRYYVGERRDLGDLLYQHNLKLYYKALNYADLDEQDNLFHLMQLMLQRKAHITDHKSGIELKMPAGDFLLVQGIISNLMKPIMFAKRFDGGSLMFAAANADEATIALLADDCGVSVTEPNASGITPISFMADNGNVAAVRALHKRGAQLSDLSNDYEDRRFVFCYHDPKAKGETIYHGTILQFAILTQDRQFLEAVLGSGLISLEARKNQVQELDKILRTLDFSVMRIALENLGLPLKRKSAFGIFSFSCGSCFGASAVEKARVIDNNSPPLLRGNADSRSATATPDTLPDGVTTLPTITLSSPAATVAVRKSYKIGS